MESVEIKTLPDGTRYAVVMSWTSRGRACPVRLPADVVAIDADAWIGAQGDPERAVKLIMFLQRVNRKHRRSIVPRSRDAREIEAERQWQRAHIPGRFS